MSQLGLDPSRVARVDIITAPTAVAGRDFGNLLMLSDSPVIDVVERIRDYSSLDSIAKDLGTTSPEYLAASLFFSQVPQPTLLKVGRWASGGTSSILHGGRLSTSEQNPARFIGIGNGGMTILIDGVAQSLNSIVLYSATNMNAVATAITDELTGAVCTWDAVNQRFDITASSNGAGTKAVGHINMSAPPSANDTFTVNGVTVTFKASGATGAQVNISTTVAETMAALQAYFVAHPVSGVTTTQDASDSIKVESNTVGTAGNAITLAKVGTNLAVSGATLAGGAAASSVGYATTNAGTTDISALLRLTSATALTPVPGAAAETLLSAVSLLADMSVDWYGLYVASTTAPSDGDITSVASFIEAANPSRVFGVTVQDGGCLSATDTANLGYQLTALNLRRTFWQYSSSNAYAAASIFGRAFTVNFGGVNTTLTLKFKNQPGISAETLTTAQAAALEAVNGNVFVNYSNGAAIIEQGVMADGTFIDEVHGLDWLQNSIQTEVFNTLYQSSTKIPQTDAGVNALVAATAGRLDQSVRNGLVAPNQWNADGFGELSRGDWLEEGYYIYALPTRLQSQSDREQRKAPPIQVAVKLAGAIHSAVILVNVNR